MNCKPGDLAVLIRVLDSEFNPNIGRIVEVLHRAPDLDGEPAWTCRMVGSPGHTEIGASQQADARDRNLRPIRDPGNDAVDQTLVPGYVKDEVTA